MIPRDQELRDEAWKARRAQERSSTSLPHAESEQNEIFGAIVRGMQAEREDRSISNDGKCLVCRGDLLLMESQPQHERDWATCSYCGTSMPCVRGVLSRA